MAQFLFAEKVMCKKDCIFGEVFSYVQSTNNLYEYHFNQLITHPVYRKSIYSYFHQIIDRIGEIGTKQVACKTRLLKEKEKIGKKLDLVWYKGLHRTYYHLSWIGKK